jgi:DNA-binding GntR family transcriptional regulator
MTPRNQAVPVKTRRPSPLARENGAELLDAIRPRHKPPVPTLASIVQQKIFTEISDGDLAHGMRLEEEELARRYGVSRTPVREALRQLSALGILDIRHRQGVVVAARGEEHFNNLLEVMADLEASAARYAAQRMTAAERQQLQDLHQQMHPTADRATPRRFDKANGVLHQLIHEGAHNDILFNTIVQMRMRVLPYTRLEFISERRRMDISHMEHSSVVRAVVRGEPEMAYQAMRLHVIDAGRVLEDRLPSGG